MASSRLVKCSTNNFLKSIFWKPNVNNLYVRFQCSYAADEYTDALAAEKYVTKAKPRRMSRIEMTRLKEMKSKIRTLHGLANDIGEPKTEAFSVKSDADYDFDYFESGLKEIPEISDSDIKMKESNYIRDLTLRKDFDVLERSYGQIRMDNTKNKNKQEEGKNSNTKNVKQRDASKKEPISSLETESLNKNDIFPKERPAHSKASSNLFDKQYFNLSDNEPKYDANIEEVNQGSNFIEEQFFSTNESSSNGKGLENLHLIQNEHSLKHISKLPDYNFKKMASKSSEGVNFIDQNFFENVLRDARNEFDFVKGSQDDIIDQIDEQEDDNTTRIGNFTRREIRDIKKKKVNIQDPKTAYDVVTKMRLEGKANALGKAIDMTAGRWDGKVDNKGFRILTSQTQDLQKVIDIDLVTLLCNSIIFENEDIIVINKPYGLPSHGGPGIHKSVASLAEKMAVRRENMKTYYVVHRLDKETTGVMVLAKNERTAQILTQMFLNRQVVKVYWAITKGVPNPIEGIIDIPMGEELINGKYRMTLIPKNSREMKPLKNPRVKNAVNAVTHYKVLDNNDYSALVECRPETGIKHQIRCHLALGLNTPILGDHKYSHMSKLAPQKLFPQILQRLGIRQAKARHLAMHLHAKSLVLPEYLPDGRNLYIAANIPPHFSQNLKWLRLNPKK